jgi:hypothetical protein
MFYVTKVPSQGTFRTQNMIERRFLVKTILRTLGKHPDLARTASFELLASRIASAIEDVSAIVEGAEVTEDTGEEAGVMLLPAEPALQPYAPGPQTPEDLGLDEVPPARPGSAAGQLPQPVRHRPQNQEKPEKPARTLILTPDTDEAREILSGTKEINPLRPRRSRAARADQPNWDFRELFDEVMARTPMTLELTPEGQTAQVTLDRTVQSDQATGIVKVTYSVAGQRESSPAARWGQDSLPDPVTVPIEVSKVVNIYDDHSIDFEAIAGDLRKRAMQAFRPRPDSIASHTPQPPGSLDLVLSRAIRSERPGEKASYKGISDSV